MNAKLNDFKIYVPERQRESIHRLFFEVGWAGKDNQKFIDALLAAGRAWVVEIDGEAESIAHTTSAMLRYMDADLSCSCVSAVATSRIARKQGIASHLTAHALAKDVEDGAFVSMIGVFEQGFYNQLGFGMGGYEHIVTFDPTKLNVPAFRRVPKRLSKSDWKMIHQSRLNRMRGHGSLNLLPAEFSRAAIIESQNGFGLGYSDADDGALSHHLWIATNNVERGPYKVVWMAYQSYAQFVELLSLLETLGDQVLLVKMHEPSGIQMQDFIQQPLKERFASSGSKFESGVRSLAYWQVRICNLQACIDHTHLSCEPFSMNLVLHDPIEVFLTTEYAWMGLSGQYTISFGPTSFLQKGLDPDLPTLVTSIGAFSRMWLGVRPASGLSVTDQLTAPSELLQQLDRAFRFPDPKPDWVI